MFIRSTCLLILSLIVTTTFGCSNSETDRPLLIAGPLDLDPSHEIDVVGWWSNGAQLLYLGENNAYRLFESLNRHQPAAERGQWRRQSYATLWLSPYRLSGTSETRISLTRAADGVIELHLGNLTAMRAVTSPPVVAEDHLIGEWRNEAATLRLMSDGRYSFSPVPSSTSAATAGHSGIWRVTNDRLVLVPDAPSIKAPAITFTISGNQHTLSLNSAAMSKVAE